MAIRNWSAGDWRTSSHKDAGRVDRPQPSSPRAGGPCVAGVSGVAIWEGSRHDPVPYGRRIAGLDCVCHTLRLLLACITYKATRFTLPLLERTALLAIASSTSSAAIPTSAAKTRPDAAAEERGALRLCAARELFDDRRLRSTTLPPGARRRAARSSAFPMATTRASRWTSSDFDGMIQDLSRRARGSKSTIRRTPPRHTDDDADTSFSVDSIKRPATPPGGGGQPPDQSRLRALPGAHRRQSILQQ
jgi:hypothetical protein